MEQQWVKLLECKRQGVPEVAVHGAVAWVHGDSLVRSLGNVTTFGRSLMKPYQMKVFAQELASGYSPEAQAIALSSHNAEPSHLAAAQSMLPGAESGLLQTPPSLPMPGSVSKVTTAERWHHPCSGKHAAILSGCKHRGWSRDNYLDPSHPYHAAYREALRTVLGPSWTPSITAVDGCGLPTHAMTLKEMGTLFAALVAHRAQDWIWAAMVGHPELIGGQGRLDTAIMIAGQGRVLAKEGADGLLGLAIVHPDYPRGLGIVVKIAHGWDPRMMGYIASHILMPLGIAYKGPAAPSGQVCIMSQ